MHVGGHALQDFVRTMPWWVAFGYVAQDDTWLPGGVNSYYVLSMDDLDPTSKMVDAEVYAAQAQHMLDQLQEVIVGLTRNWKQQGQIWCWACSP